MERYFEKISYEEFVKTFGENKELYEEYKLPKRATKNSAAYDLLAIQDVIIKPREIKKIPTGIKVFMQNDEALLLIVRSSMGFKYNVRMCNQVGLIDSDYYNNASNEGHMFVALQNEGTKEYIVKKGEAYSQALFIKYLTCGDNPDEERTGGFGSTNKKEGKNNE